MADDGEQIQLVQVRGELDLVTADTLAACGYAAIGRPARELLLDLTGVSFCDAHGLRALVRIADHADQNRLPAWSHRAAATGGEGPTDHRPGPAAAGMRQR